MRFITRFENTPSTSDKRGDGDESKSIFAEGESVRRYHATEHSEVAGRFITTNAIVLKRINYSDSDRIYTLLTSDFGKISAIAKGVRKIKSRKAGHLDLGCIVKVSLAQGKNLYILTQAETVQTVEFAKGNLKLANAILEAIESINKALYEGQAGSFYYNLYCNFRNNLNTGKPIDSELLSLYKLLIIHLGLWSDTFEGKPLSFLRSYFENVTESKIRRTSP